MATAIAAEPVFFRAAVGDPIKVEGKVGIPYGIVG